MKSQPYVSLKYLKHLQQWQWYQRINLVSLSVHEKTRRYRVSSYLTAPCRTLSQSATKQGNQPQVICVLTSGVRFVPLSKQTRPFTHKAFVYHKSMIYNIISTVLHGPPPRPLL